MTVLLVGEKCSCTPGTLRFFASLRLTSNKIAYFWMDTSRGKFADFKSIAQ